MRVSDPSAGAKYLLTQYAPAVNRGKIQCADWLLQHASVAQKPCNRTEFGGQLARAGLLHDPSYHEHRTYSWRASRV